MRLIPGLATAIAIFVSPAPSAELPVDAPAHLEAAIEPERLYEGWRASALLDKPVHGWNGEKVGEVKDILVAADGSVAAIAVRGGGLLGIGGAVFPIPWSRVEIEPGREGVRIPLTKMTIEELGLYDGPGQVILPPGVWRVTDLIEKPARPANLVEFGTVADLVFGKEGRGLAVLVRRGGERQVSGGGKIEERQSKESPHMFAFHLSKPSIRQGRIEYYPLSYESAELAVSAPRVAIARFDPGLF